MCTLDVLVTDVKQHHIRPRLTKVSHYCLRIALLNHRPSQDDFTMS